MIHEERVKQLNANSIQNGNYVLYWMQASQRTDYNHALEYAIQLANKYKLPIVVYFGLTCDYPEANERSYLFLLDGLADVEAGLAERNIPFVVRQEDPSSGAIELAKDCSILVVDRDYQRLQRLWRSQVAASVRCPVIQVESNVVVPVEVTSPKEEYSAGTFRPKIHRELDRFMQGVAKITPSTALNKELHSLRVTDPKSIAKGLSIDRSVREIEWLKGGERKATKHLSTFITEKLNHFHTLRNDPANDYLSWMSPYLHFGHISPIEIALEVMEAGGEGSESYLEELIVRRELSMNFVFYNSHYDSIDCLPNWAKTTLHQHTSDRREYIYSQDELEFAETQDSYWNAAQIEMTKTGKMHGYMRMYWGKKILEWSESPSEAYRVALYLNNKYELDGRDPNGYTGVAWCFGKHDRAWKERPVFGKVRYMNARGLERKFDIEAYVRRVN